MSSNRFGLTRSDFPSGYSQEGSLIDKLQDTIAQQDATIQQLKAQLQSSENSGKDLRHALETLSEATIRKDVRIANFQDQLIKSQLETDNEKINTRYLEKQRDDLGAQLKSLSSSLHIITRKYEALLIEMGQVQSLNANLKAAVERSPAPPRYQKNQQLIPARMSTPFPQHYQRPTSSTPLSSHVGRGHRQESQSMVAFTGSSSYVAGSSFGSSPLSSRRPEIIGQGPNQLSIVLPSFGTVPTPRKVDLQAPAAKSMQKIGLEHYAVSQAFDEVFTSFEDFAKRWTNHEHQHGVGRVAAQQQPPPIVSEHWSKFDNIGAVSALWNDRELRYMLVMRHMVSFFLETNLSMNGMYAFFKSGGQEISILQQTEAQLLDPATSSRTKERLLIDQAAIISSLDTKFLGQHITKIAQQQAHSLAASLTGIISPTPECLVALSDLYVRLGRLPFSILSHQASWRYDWPRGGKSVFWSASVHAAMNKSLGKMTNADIKKMDLKVLFTCSPAVTMTVYTNGSVHTKCVRIAGVILSRNGVQLDHTGG